MMKLMLIILFFTTVYNANSSPTSWQKRANELALTNFIGTNSIGGYVQPNNHVVIQNVPKHGTATTTASWPAELPKSYASKSTFTLPPVRYEEDKTGLIGSLKRKISSSSESSSNSNKVQKTTKSTIKEAIVKQRNKPQRVQSLAHGRVEDAKWEKIYFSAATGAAVIAKKVYDQSKNAAKTAKEKCLVACESFKKSVSFSRSTSANASTSKSTSLNKSTRFNKQRSLNKGRSFSKSQSLSRKIVTQGRTIVKRDLIFIKRSNSESQGSKEEEKQPLKKESKGKRRQTSESVERQSSKRRRRNTGIRIGREEEEQQQKQTFSSSLRQHRRVRASTAFSLRKNELRKKMYRLRFNKNQSKARIVRNTITNQPQTQPRRPVRQASSFQTVRSQLAYQSDSSVSSALSNHREQVQQTSNIRDHSDLLNGSGSGESSVSFDR